MIFPKSVFGCREFDFFWDDIWVFLYSHTWYYVNNISALEIWIFTDFLIGRWKIQHRDQFFMILSSILICLNCVPWSLLSVFYQRYSRCACLRLVYNQVGCALVPILKIYARFHMCNFWRHAIFWTHTIYLFMLNIWLLHYFDAFVVAILAALPLFPIKAPTCLRWGEIENAIGLF